MSECRSKFPVAADQDQSIMKSYDSVLLYKTCYADRVSYVIAPNGSIVYEYSSMYPEKHVSKTLQALEQWGRQEKEVISKVLQN